MNVEVLSDARAVGEAGAGLVADAVRSDPVLALGVATGSSPLPLYAALARRVRDGLDTTGVTAWALDEYVGLAPDHPESYRAVVDRTVTRPLGLDPHGVHVPDGAADDPHAAADAYEGAVTDAGVDLQILGLGHNGHVAFNEPGSPGTSRTRVVRLTERTRHANARFFGDAAAVPTHAITQGVATIMSARRLLLVATGADKAAAVAAAVAGPVDVACPGSLLRRHPDVTVLVDEAAGALLPREVRDARAGRRGHLERSL